MPAKFGVEEIHRPKLCASLGRWLTAKEVINPANRHCDAYETWEADETGKGNSGDPSLTPTSHQCRRQGKSTGGTRQYSVKQKSPDRLSTLVSVKKSRDEWHGKYAKC